MIQSQSQVLIVERNVVWQPIPLILHLLSFQSDGFLILDESIVETTSLEVRQAQVVVVSRLGLHESASSFEVFDRFGQFVLLTSFALFGICLLLGVGHASLNNTKLEVSLILFV